MRIPPIMLCRAGFLPRKGASIVRRGRARVETLFESASVIAERAIEARKAQKDLVVFDDIFPSKLSGFRLAEFNYYLSSFDRALVYSTGSAFTLLGECRSLRDVVLEYEASFPQFRNKVQKFHVRRAPNARLAYTMFLHNISYFLGTITASRLPFVFTLYPGGGFQLDNPTSDGLLRSAFESPLFRKVIVTQKITRDYIIQGGFCDPSAVAFIYGGVFPAGDIPVDLSEKRRFGDGKSTFDVCFVAYKYMKGGIDKGYDVFIQFAKKLSAKYDNTFFHVAGSFDETDADIIGLTDRIRFYGTLGSDLLPGFFAGMDVIVSPNAPFLVKEGSFDGFPTGACIEAGLSGVAVFCTDPLDQNFLFVDGRDIVIVQREVEDICNRVERYYLDCSALEVLARQGQLAFHEAFSLKYQMEARMRLFEEVLSEES